MAKYNGDRVDVISPQGTIMGYIEGYGGNVRAYYYGKQVAWYDECSNITYTFDCKNYIGDRLEYFIMREWAKEHPGW